MTLPVTFEVEIGTRAVAIETSSPHVSVSPGIPTVIVIASPGPPGPPGPPGDGTQVVGEAATGVIDGVNASFSVSDPYLAGSTAVYLNGLRETYYSETGPAEITFDDPPISGDTITIDYVIA